MIKTNDRRMAEVRAEVTNQREYFERAVLRSGYAAGTAAVAAKQDVIDRTRQEFDRLEQKLALQDLDGVADSARSLARMRGYLWPLEEAKEEAAGALSGMEDWGVPGDVLDRLRPDVERLRRAPEPEARAILYQLYADHDYWWDYIDSLYRRRKWVGWGGGVVVVLCSILSFWWLLHAHMLWGFAAGAASGAALSVMRKLPPVAVYRRVADFDVRVVRRFVSGLMASLVTLGLIQTGVISIPLPRGTDLLTVFSSCTRACRWAEASVLFALALPLGFSERLLTAVGDALVPMQAKADRTSIREDSAAT